MAITQTVLFTVIPRGPTLNPAKLPVSVLVSPRLDGATRLDAFADWLNWTDKVKAGATFVFRCGARTASVRIDTGPLRPDLWHALFKADTLVAARQVDRYVDHEVMSYSVRESLSALKAVYQEASVVLALPDAADAEDPNDPAHGQERAPRVTNRQRLAAILNGLDVHWSGRNAKEWRNLARHRSRSGIGARVLNGPLDAEGLITTARNPDSFRNVAGPFSAYHHMPTPELPVVGELKFDPKAFDFHKALAALEAHPELQRMLGLVFHFDLPLDLVPATPTGTPVNLSVESTNLVWQLAPKSPALQTACVHVSTGNVAVFCAASRTQSTQGGPLQAFGLLNLDPACFGLAQVDVDGAMHKAITTAEIYNNPDPGRSVAPTDPDPAPNPEVYDPEATLPSMRSGGLQLYLDGRGATTVDAIAQSQAFNQAVESGGAQPRPFYAEDLIRGYCLDVWQSRTNQWHSLHQRLGSYSIGEPAIALPKFEEEGFFQLAATQPAPKATNDKDLYVHEIIARWAGWSLSVPFPGKALSRYGKAADSIPPDGDNPDYRTDEALTAFKIRATYEVKRGSLPLLRFGSRYRIRARAVDLAGYAMKVNDAVAEVLAGAMALPRDVEGQAYLRWDPVPAPLVVIRDQAAVTTPGSALHRLVIRTFNTSVDHDTDAAVLSANDRHVVPPRTSVELAERMGMFDGPDGKLKGDAATYNLAANRDAGTLNVETFKIGGKLAENVPVEPAASIDSVPYLPDLYARGAAIRDLPGTPDASITRASAADPAARLLAYDPLTDINPRPGSATLISFNPGSDWQQTVGFRLVLAEPTGADPTGTPHWDPAARVLTVFLPKGRSAVVPLSSYSLPADLKLLGQWQWMREFVDLATIFFAQPAHLLPGQPVDVFAHVLQRTVEGGHWMLNPPTLLTFVHAVQQPLGTPSFAALNVQHSDLEGMWYLQRDRVRDRVDPEELAPITSWRRLGESSSYLLGAIRIHGASTAKVDLRAEWSDPIDDPLADPNYLARTRDSIAAVDELPLPRRAEGYLVAPGALKRRVGYYDPENDQIAMVREGDRAGLASARELYFFDAAPKHEFSDTKRHQVSYTAVATSRYREYFDPHPAGEGPLVFTRESQGVLVDVPASSRPVAPALVYVMPTFGWQRQSDTNIKRSVRFGGGLRVYLDRPWFSSGVGELLGVALWNGANGPLNDDTRDKFKSYFTQWGMDPIWQTAALSGAPRIENFPDGVGSDRNVSLEELSARQADGKPGRVDVVGFKPSFDEERKLWFADLTIDLAAHPNEFIQSATYAPFIRLALVRYQPHALDDARISRVVLAGFAQLTPDRTAVVTADPHHPRTLRLVVSGVAPSGPPPTGPAAEKPTRPTDVRVRVQKRNGAGELDWQDAPAAEATVTQFYEGQGLFQPNLGLWVGHVTFAAKPAAGTYRLLVEEFEYISANWAEGRRAPGRLIYAEFFAVDTALVGE